MVPGGYLGWHRISFVKLCDNSRIYSKAFRLHSTRRSRLNSNVTCGKDYAWLYCLCSGVARNLPTYFTKWDMLFSFRSTTCLTKMERASWWIMSILTQDLQIQTTCVKHGVCTSHFSQYNCYLLFFFIGYLAIYIIVPTCLNYDNINYLELCNYPCKIWNLKTKLCVPSYSCKILLPAGRSKTQSTYYSIAENSISIISKEHIVAIKHTTIVWLCKAPSHTCI